MILPNAKWRVSWTGIRTDQKLIESTAFVVKKEKVLTLQVLEHLAEMSQRKLFAVLGYGSLFEYCVKSLKYGGTSAAPNIRLLCSNHNKRAAIEAFGLNKMQKYLQ
ncbi:MAG: hypothetical protein WCG27_08690 [Pseudomonadota bacterium]